MTLEILTIGSPVQARGAPHLFQYMALGARSMGLQVSFSMKYTGRSRVIAMYGCGNPEKSEIVRRHVAAGGNAVCWDLAYFSRGSSAQRDYLRVSIDRLHPSVDQVEATPDSADRFAAHGIQLREDYDPAGPVIVIGLGLKSRTGLALHDWECTALQAARTMYPDRRIIYRPKPRGGKRGDDGVRWDDVDGTTPIERLLCGASLVVCRHSNVALDACIAGIPVDCEDGVARWLYAQTKYPTPQQRLSLLHRAAWWQWRVSEMGAAWKFLLPRLSSIRSGTG